jgi:esterase/lipase
MGQSKFSWKDAFGALLLAGAGVRWLSTQEAKKNLERFKRFHPLPDTESYEETRPLSWTPRAKAPHAVLLLHGWSGSTKDFFELTRHLQEAGIPFFAPRLTGFGLSTTRLLEVVEACDWKRDALEAFDLLSCVADKVSVVGHSNGGVLAVYVAQHRTVDHLVLSAPNLFVSQQDAWRKQLLKTPILNSLLIYTKPYFEKPTRPGLTHEIDVMDAQAAQDAFQQHVMPTQSIKALWDLQDDVDVKKANYKKMVLLFGAHDQTVDYEAVVADFKKRHLNFDQYIFEHSGHNFLEDYDKAEASKLIVSFLQTS